MPERACLSALTLYKVKVNLFQDKQDGLKPDETAEMNHGFSPDLGDHRGRLEMLENRKKPGKHCGVSTISSGLEDGWLECSSAGYVFASRWASFLSSASVKLSYR